MISCYDLDFKREGKMSRVCEICGKGAMTGNKVSHSNRKASKTWQVNLQETTMEIDGKVKKVTACTKCIKTNKK